MMIHTNSNVRYGYEPYEPYRQVSNACYLFKNHQSYTIYHSQKLFKQKELSDIQLSDGL